MPFKREHGTKISAEVYSNYKQKGNQFYDISGLDKSDEFNIKEPSLPKEPEPPEFMKKNLDKGWQPVTENDQKLVNKLKVLGISLGGAKFAAQLALRLASGNTTPIRRSPGIIFDVNARSIIASGIETALKHKITKFSHIIIKRWIGKL